MRKSRKFGRLPLRAANDNSAQKRGIHADFPPDLPLMEIELEIVETYLSSIIAELAAGPEFWSANDNELDVSE